LKNKTKTYLLLVAVLGIWGTIGYKIINGINPEEPEINPQNFDITFNPKEEKTIDTFSIQETNRDPFLGTLSNKIMPKGSRNLSNANHKPVVNLLNITFSGLIKKQNSSDQVFVVTINNKQHLLKKGQVVDSVKLVHGNSKEIVVLFKNTTQKIKRN